MSDKTVVAPGSRQGTLVVNGEEYHPLVYYLRKSPKNGDKRGAPYGVIVALNKELIGWSICNWRDSWNRGRAISIAAGRATRGLSHWMKEFSQWVSKDHDHIGEVKKSGLPKLHAVYNAMCEMQERAIRYYERGDRTPF